MAYIKLSGMPDPKVEYTVNFSVLNGGLNINELDYRLGTDESPDIQNLIWRDGVLSSRDGQVWVSEDKTLGKGYALYERQFNGWLFAHIGAKIYALKPSADEPVFVQVYEGAPEIRGSFFQYYDKLYYKTVGAYIQIEYNSTDDTFTAGAVEGYIPNTVLNATPAEGAGDLYQPENRIQSKKQVKYNASEGVTEYHLPVASIDAVTEVKVDGVVKTEGTDYTVNKTTGVVTFVTAPPVTTPATNNTVWITYDKANPDAYNSIMDCPYAATYGGSGDLCIVVGGCKAQPNAYFWNGNNIAMDATYFPFSQYQLAGGADDAVTGFGKQQSYLVVFKEHSVGRTKLDTTEVDERLTIDLPYIAINDKIGCDLPWTIQLVDNNLMWCNREQGVHVLKDSSSAYENNIMCVSLKINGTGDRPGFLSKIRRAEVVSSLDDGKRYWVCTAKEAWVYDYENTAYKDPSWYYFTNINAVSFASELDDTWHLDADGRLTHFTRGFADYGQAIYKKFKFATQFFGGYDRLKTVKSVIIVTRSDTNSTAQLTYSTDYGTYKDPTALASSTWRLSPRNLATRNLEGAAFGSVFRRRPLLRRVRHFTMWLENNTAGEDLSIVSAQIFYVYEGRLR